MGCKAGALPASLSVPTGTNLVKAQGRVSGGEGSSYRIKSMPMVAISEGQITLGQSPCPREPWGHPGVMGRELASQPKEPGWTLSAHTNSYMTLVSPFTLLVLTCKQRFKIPIFKGLQ